MGVYREAKEYIFFLYLKMALLFLSIMFIINTSNKERKKEEKLPEFSTFRNKPWLECPVFLLALSRVETLRETVTSFEK